MSLQSFLFVAIDKLYNPFQNERKMTKFKDVEFDIKTDIVYDTSSPEACKLDTYRVKGQSGKKLPVLFYIHGGGFVAGDKHYRRALARWSAVQGYFVVNVNYGLCPEYQCPVPHKQLVAALNWVGANAEKLGLDLDRMIVSGDSAGGYYGAMLACICISKSLQDKLGVHTDLKFGGAVLNCGIYDVATALKNKYPFDLGGKLLKDFAGIKKDEIDSYEWKDLCSVLPFVTEEFPVSFITHAQKDIFCGGQADGLMKLLADKGVHVEEFHSTSLIDNHCFSLNWKSKAARKNNELTADFMKRFAEHKV